MILGAMLVICDVNEYRKCVKEEMKVAIITQLFERLHALCNLLVVVPENLKVVRGGEQLVSHMADFLLGNYFMIKILSPWLRTTNYMYLKLIRR